ncbi:MAG: hypothetical protein KAS17_03320 [Victivallaceae bacterium]|nr:hypothetical protein [Victivallaceae bacterium]
MGTSSSSSGPGPGLPYEPPWLDNITPDIGPPAAPSPDIDPVPEPQDKPEKIPVETAPAGRFGPARRYLGAYMSSGDRSSLTKALGNYSRKGMGGASNVAKRMRVSTSAGAELFKTLQEVRDSSNTNIRDWVDKLTEHDLSADEIADEIIDKIITVGGSPEEESCRISMSQALSDLLTFNPDIDLMNMDNDNIWTVMELFMANEAFNRLCFDIGQMFESAKYTPSDSVSRMNDMRDYLKQEVSAQIQELRAVNQNPTKDEVNSLLQSAVKVTFEVFEEEI